MSPSSGAKDSPFEAGADSPGGGRSIWQIGLLPLQLFMFAAASYFGITRIWFGYLPDWAYIGSAVVALFWLAILIFRATIRLRVWKGSNRRTRERREEMQSLVDEMRSEKKKPREPT